MNEQVISLAGISAPWLADELDERGVVRLQDVFTDEWLTALRSSVTDYIAGRGDGDFFIYEPDHEIGSPAHRLVSDPALRQLFSEATRLRLPKADSAQRVRCVIPVRAGNGSKMRSNLFHYDASVLTMVVPIFIPQETIGTCGELAVIGNKRPFRRFVGSHLVDTVLTSNPRYRRKVALSVHGAPEKYIVPLQPGDAYVFWGYRTFHGNLDCAPGLVRATLVFQFGEVHSGSGALKLAWRFSRSRRDFGRFQYLPETPADSIHRV